MDLNGKWILTGVDESNNPIELEAAVPGCVHTDLIEHGIIKDLYWRDNSKLYQWIENKDFTYEKSFYLDEIEENAYLEFDGLDTYCDIFLNGEKIGSAENMFIPHEFCVDGMLKKGENKLTVAFRSPIKAVEGMPEMPYGAFTKERLNTRRIQCTYGWDWVDRFVTMGIYRDVRLVFRKPNEIDNVYVYTKRITPFSAQIKAEINFRDVISETEWVNIEIYSPDDKLIFSKKRMILKETMDESFDIRNPQLWYPNGYGEQPLYKLVLSTEHSRKETIFGIREITVIQLEDEEGSEMEKLARIMQNDDIFKERDNNEKTAGFTVVVNDVKIMCKGGNWVPCEPFPSAETPEKIGKILDLCHNGGVNMLRVWGGGIFEQDFFYEECDRLGILVTQDFLMACGQYPEHYEWFIKALNEEARAAALRLRNHACLAWWSGDNENGERGTENTAKFSGYLAATYGAEPIIKQYDRERYFFPSSPYGGDLYSSVTRGTTHNTNYQFYMFDLIRNTPFDDYVEFLSKMFARFSAEQSCLGLPFVSSLRNFMTDEDIFGEDAYISEFHTKNGCAKEMEEFTLFDAVVTMAEKVFGRFTSPQDSIKKQQMVQCEWIRLTFEAHRRNKGYCSGLVYWMMNDCWPATNGWSIIDYYAKPKPAYYTFKRCAKPVVASLEKKDGKLNIYVSNDKLTECTGKGSVYLYDFKENKKLTEKSFEFSIEANEAGKVYECDFAEFELNGKTIIICDIESNINSDRAFYMDNFSKTELTYKDAQIIDEDAQSITVKAEEFIPYVMLDVPYELEENCFTMLNGEVKKIMKIK